MPATIFAAKVIGNTALGIWAGYNLSISHAPSSFTPCDARQAFLRRLNWFGIKVTQRKEASTRNVCEKQKKLSIDELLKRAVKSLHISAISALTVVPNLIAYFLADRRGRHPYLMYVALGAQLAGALQFFGSREMIAQIKTESNSSEDKDTFEHVTAESTASSDSSSGSHCSEVSTNDKYSIFSTVSAGLTAFLFIISTIGLAGDATYA